MLSPAQQTAVDATDPRILCLAAPGSGKTRVMVERVARLLRQGYHPKEILVLTFTRRAAGELADRVRAMGLKPPRIHTFHGWAATLLREFHDVLGWAWNFSIYDDQDVDDLILYSGAELGLTKKWKSAKRLWREENVKASVRRLLREANATDYDGLEFFLSKVLQERPDISGRYTHVLVDEGQDTSDIQQRILVALNPPNLFVVGDPGQSIYGFRGANLKGFTDWGKDYTILTLPTNYRSSPEIVATASRMGAAMEPAGLEQVHADGAPAGDVGWFQAGNFEPVDPGMGAGRDMVWAAMDDIGSLIADIQLAAVPGETQAILSPTWRPLEALVDELAAAEVVYHLARPVPLIWDSTEMRVLVAALRVAHNPHDHLSLKTVLNATKPPTAAQWAEARALALAEGIPMLQASARVAGIMHFHPGADATSLTMVQVCARMGRILEAHWVDMHFQSRVKALEKCVDEILATRLELEEFLAWYGSRQVQGIGEEKKPEGLILSSIHAAKGLEWDQVWILRCDRMAEWPGTDDGEKLRLLYVAATRARRRLRFVGWDESSVFVQRFLEG